MVRQVAIALALSFGVMISAESQAAIMQVGNGGAGQGLVVQKDIDLVQPPDSALMFTVPMAIKGLDPFIGHL